MMKLKRISTNCLIAGTLLLGTAAQAEMINLTATDQPDGTIGGSCPSGPGCVTPVVDPFGTGASFTTAAAGVTFFVDHLQPSGTGVLDPFVRIQAKDSEQGYNTSGRPLNFDTKNPLNYTHDLAIGSLEAVNGAYEFILDIGENNSGPGNNKPNDNSLLSLDGVKLYAVNFTTSPNGEIAYTSGNAPNPWNVGDWDPSLNPESGFSYQLLWDMDATTDNAVLLDANRLGNPPGNGR